MCTEYIISYHCGNRFLLQNSTLEYFRQAAANKASKWITLCSMYSHDAELHAQYLLQYLTSCDKCLFMIGLQQWHILEFDLDTFSLAYLAIMKLQELTEAIWNEEDSLTLPAVTWHTSDSCNPNQQDGSRWFLCKLKSAHGWMSLSMYEEGLLWMKKVGKWCARCKLLWLQDVKLECFFLFSGKVEVKLKTPGWHLQSIQTEKLEWIDTPLNCLLLLIMVRGRSCWWLVSAVFSHCYWKIQARF